MMSEASVRVLLLGESFGHSLHLLPRLEERGLPLLECHVLRGRRISIPGTQVSTDSERKLDKDGSARDFFPGPIRLQRLPCSTGGEKLLVAATHEKRSGRSWRSGPPALRPSQFARALDQILQEIRARRAMASKQIQGVAFGGLRSLKIAS
jgi:hypothetical protein